MNFKRMKKALWNKKYGLPIAFLLFVFFFGLFYLIIDFQILPFDSGVGTNCRIEYSQYKCVDGRAIIAFYNPNTQPITFVRISIPVKSGTDIFNVSETLYPRVTDTITTTKCDEIAGSVFFLEWCCTDKCYKTRMTKPNPNITIG